MSTTESAAAPSPAAKPAAQLIHFSLGSGLLFIAVSLLVLWQVYTQTAAGAPALTFSDNALQNIGNVLAPLAVIALFIERAVEVVITAWRDPGAMRLKHDLKAAPADRKAGIQQELDHYRLHTQRFSFGTSITLSLVAAMVGVRGVAPLLTGAPTAGAFQGFDIVVTALLLAGGADGLHQIMTTFTDFLDNTKAKLNPSTTSGTVSGSGDGGQG